MATTPAPASDLRYGVAELSRLADGDLDALWRDISTADEARDALSDVLPSLIEVYGVAAAALAADWYSDARERAAVRGAFSPVLANVKPQGGVSLAKWAVGPMYQAEPDILRTRTIVRGGLQLRIADAARYTVAGSAVADPSAQGWQRAGDGNSCAFCLMLISRAAVYRESSADFASHDHCGCMAVPAWSGEPVPVKPYTPSARQITDADRARVKAWIGERF